MSLSASMTTLPKMFFEYNTFIREFGKKQDDFGMNNIWKRHIYKTIWILIKSKNSYSNYKKFEEDIKEADMVIRKKSRHNHRKMITKLKRKCIKKRQQSIQVSINIWEIYFLIKIGLGLITQLNGALRYLTTLYLQSERKVSDLWKLQAEEKFQ